MDQANNLKKTDDTTCYHHPGCGFFGNPATRDLCSKCYRDSLKEEKGEQARSVVFKNLSPTKGLPPDLTVPDTNPFPCFRALSACPTATAGEKNVTDSTTKKNRCHSCNKKIGLLGFACRCGPSFCSVHRYPEAHRCSFDFKSAGRVALAKENPLCKADKMQKRL